MISQNYKVKIVRLCPFYPTEIKVYRLCGNRTLGRGTVDRRTVGRETAIGVDTSRYANGLNSLMYMD